jgi:hypothetical protein
MNHFMNNGNEYLKKEKKIRQYRSNQGRSPERMEKTYKILSWSFKLLIGTILITWLCGVFGLEL